MIRIFLHRLSVQEYLSNVDLGQVLHITDIWVKTISVGNFGLLVDIAKKCDENIWEKKNDREDNDYKNIKQGL